LTVAAITLSTAAIAFAVSSSNKQQPKQSRMASSSPVLPEGTIQSSFVNGRSQRIHTIQLSPSTSTTKKSNKVATVFFLHGIGDHSGRPCYGRLYKKLVSQNVEVFAMDHHGHGQSEGQPRAYCDRFEDYVEDYLTFIETNWTDDSPLFLAGHSLGGLMVILLANQLGSKVKGVVLTSPACGVEMDLEKKMQTFLAPVIDTLCPKARVSPSVRLGTVYSLTIHYL
jgi:alpha-beta hydrolase superfamily lysophospholipase